MSSPTICCIIPTYNEEDLLRQAVQSLVDEGVAGLHILVVNAGKPLSADIAAMCEEVKVPDEFFWTHCIGKGFEIIRERGTYDYAMMDNADTVLVPGTVNRLVEVAAQGHVAASPGYMQTPDGKVELMYSAEKFYPFLFHFRLVHGWKSLEDAPDSPPYETPAIGGQGVVFKAEYLKQFDVDPKTFPQGKGDFDLWLQMRRAGIKIMMVPKAGAINLRGFGELARTERKKRLKKLWPRATSIQSNDGLHVMWQFRKKFMPLPLAVLSTAVMYPWRQVKGLVDAIK